MYVHLTNINTVLDQLDCMYYCLNRASQQVDGHIEAAQAAMSVLSVFRRGGLVTDFLIDGRRIGQFRETRITSEWLLSDRNSKKCNLI